MTELSFQEPLWLALLALVPLAWFVPRRARPAEGLTRSLALALVVFVLAGPALQTSSSPTHVAVVVDASASAALPVDLGPRVDEVLAELAPSSRVTVVDVGEPIDLASGAPRVSTGSDPADRRGSPLGDALAAAARSIPEGAPGSLVLISDGASTDTSWGRATADLAARGIPVHVVPLETRVDDLRPVQLRPQGELLVGQIARIAITLVGRASSVDVVLSGPDGELAAARDLICDGGTSLVLEFEPEESGWLPLAVDVTDNRSGADARPGNERLETTVAVQDPLRLLYYGDKSVGGAEQLSELLGAGFEVSEGGAGTNALDDADLVLLDDASVGAVTDDEQRAIAASVRDDGMGLVMAGGGAFGPGGWHDTPVADLLPVEALQKEEKRDPSTTLVVIIDTSGSMGGNRVQLAKEVARLAIGRLLPHDKVGIVEFYGAKRWAAPIQPASNRIEIERALNRLNAGGGTVILPAIEEAFYGMQNVQTRYRHVLVLTDGGVERGSFEPMIRRMADEGVNVSTVLIGPDAHSEFLVTIANWGKGRFYAVPNRFNLPEILLKQPTSAKLPAWRSGEHTVRARGGPSWWGEVDPTSVPPLTGYVDTRARPGAEVLIETAAGAQPILATWRNGLGRVTALTTGTTGRGSEPWSEWDGYGAFLGRVFARTASDSAAPYRWSLTRLGRRLELVAERNVAAAPAPAARTIEAAATRELELAEVAPGRFEASLLAEPDREVRVEAFGGSRRTRLVSPARAGIAPETQVDPQRALDLARLAAATGGSLVSPGGLGSFRPTAGGGGAPVALVDLRTAALLLALLAFLANLLFRRWPSSPPIDS